MKRLLTALSVKFDWFYFPKIGVIDIIEILFLSFIIYHIMIWFKKTRAWTLFKGIAVLAFFVALAALLQMNTILWIFRNAISVGIIAVIVLFQPELRRALEELGRKNIIGDMWMRDDRRDGDNRISEVTIRELVEATVEMGKVKTGALIVI